MLSGAERRRIRGLGRRRNREREGLFIAQGIRVVEELLDAGVSLRVVAISSSLEDTERGARLADRLDDAATVVRASTGELRELGATATPQGVLAVAEIPARALDDVALADDDLVLMLDGVQDPGNLGTLARSAAAFGGVGLLCLTGTVDPWNPKAVRASAGALFRLGVVQTTWPEVGGWLDGRGCRVLGADAGGEPVSGIGAGDPVALVVGNEGAGLSGEARSRCDALVSVPMPGGTESLNVAVAAGILLYELSGRRA